MTPFGLSPPARVRPVPELRAATLRRERDGLFRGLAPAVVGGQLVVHGGRAQVAVEKARPGESQERLDVRIGQRGLLEPGFELVELLRVLVVVRGESLQLAHKR